MSFSFPKLIIVCGHYGTGKTNLSLNLAHRLHSEGKSVTLVDLDVVNPYFRSSDYTKELESLAFTCWPRRCRHHAGHSGSSGEHLLRV